MIGLDVDMLAMIVEATVSIDYTVALALVSTSRALRTVDWLYPDILDVPRHFTRDKYPELYWKIKIEDLTRRDARMLDTVNNARPSAHPSPSDGPSDRSLLLRRMRLVRESAQRTPDHIHTDRPTPRDRQTARVPITLCYTPPKKNRHFWRPDLTNSIRRLVPGYYHDNLISPMTLVIVSQDNRRRQLVAGVRSARPDLTDTRILSILRRVSLTAVSFMDKPFPPTDRAVQFYVNKIRPKLSQFHERWLQTNRKRWRDMAHSVHLECTACLNAKANTRCKYARCGNCCVSAHKRNLRKTIAAGRWKLK